MKSNDLMDLKNGRIIASFVRLLPLLHRLIARLRGGQETEGEREKRSPAGIEPAMLLVVVYRKQSVMKAQMSPFQCQSFFLDVL